MIEITPTARARMLEFLAANPAAAGVRFAASPSGCSGYRYRVELADSVADGDRRLEVEGVPLVIDRTSLGILDGTRIDFRSDGLSAAFAFDNPNATGECGCGESFTVANPTTN